MPVETNQNVIDSLFIANDSLSMIKDSVFAVDTVQTINVIQRPDTLKTQIVTGFEGIPHPSYPGSEDWVFGTLLFFFSLSVISFLRSSTWFYESIRTFFKVKKRSSLFVRSNINDFHSQLFLIFFSLGVLTLYVYSTLLMPAFGFRFTEYLVLFGITVLLFSLKYMLSELIGYVFVNKESLKLARTGYINLLVYLGMLLFPILVFQLYSPEKTSYFAVYIGLFSSILAALLLTVKLFQIFFDRIVVSFYILLYLCTLEIMPFIFLYWLFRMIVLDV